MELRRDGWFRADKGKHFVLTETGKNECASYKFGTVGEPVDEYDDEAVQWAVEKGYVIEVDIPDWVVTTGYEVVYDNKGYTLHAGNPIVFPNCELAEKYKKHYEEHLWMDHELYIREATYEGRALNECREYNGKKVYGTNWYYGINALDIGDLVEEEVVNTLVDMLPPACMRSDCTQLGEPSSHRTDEHGVTKSTFATFKKVADKTWEYCGDCFRGENERYDSVSEAEQDTYEEFDNEQEKD